MSKTYTLELTAEELAQVKVAVEPKAMVSSRASTPLERKLDALWETTRADREANELRLPWRVGERSNVILDNHDRPPQTNAAAKLMSAAPELLEAVRVIKQWLDSNWGEYFVYLGAKAGPLIDRAIRKVETGIPE